MDERRSSNNPSYNQYSYGDFARTSSRSGPQYDPRRSPETGQQQTYRRRSSFTTESDINTYLSDGEEDDDEDDSWGPRRSTSGSPKSGKDRSQRDRAKGKDKDKDRKMSGSSSTTASRSGGTQYGNERERTTGSSQTADRRNDTTRASTSSNTQTSSRQGSEDARGERSSRSDRASGSGSRGSRLVSGVFVRY